MLNITSYYTAMINEVYDLTNEALQESDKTGETLIKLVELKKFLLIFINQYNFESKLDKELINRLIKYINEQIALLEYLKGGD